MRTGIVPRHEGAPALPSEEKRRIVEAIAQHIVVGEGEVEINLFYALRTSGEVVL